MFSLSVIVPSIRTENLDKLYWSIVDSFKGEFELIIIGPYEGHAGLFKRLNVKYIQSWRSPNACQQQALAQAKGDYVCASADDGIFLPDTLDYAFEELMWINGRDILSGEEIVVCKYLEGDNPNPDMLKDDYYRFKYHKAYRLKGVPQDGLIFNCGIISRKFLIELGGWDCAFEATTMAHADLGIRASKAGAEMKLMKEPMFTCSHQPGKSGDHGPVHEAMKRDIKTFQKIYANPNKRINIDLENWKNTQPIWKERFK